MSAVVAALAGGRTHSSTLHQSISSSVSSTLAHNESPGRRFQPHLPVLRLPALAAITPLRLKVARSLRSRPPVERTGNSTVKVSCSVANADDFNLNDQVEQLPEDEKTLEEAVSSADNNDTLAQGSASAVKSNNSEEKSSGTKGMAEAFSISKGTALAIVTATAFLALGVPLFMQSTSAALPMKTRVLSYLTLLFGFYMAWNIGANDVANAMGTSVGSGALSLRQAVLTAAVLEFGGAFLVGSHVSHTMQKGILQLSVFEGRETLLFCGMLSSLAAAGTWLQVNNSLYDGRL